MFRAAHWGISIGLRLKTFAPAIRILRGIAGARSGCCFWIRKTGLSGGAGTVAFEIGVGWIEPRGMVIRQYVMRNYAQEADILREIAALAARADTLVTFNGKSFDLPLLESRMVMNEFGRI